MEVNKTLFINIPEDDIWLAEIILFLIYRNINPIEKFSYIDSDLLSKINNCINIFTNYSIIEYDINDDNFILKRPIFTSSIVNEEFNTIDIRKFFYKSYCGEDQRNTAKHVTKLAITKFLEKNPTKWENIVKVTESFMVDMMKKPKKERFIPSLLTFITEPRYLLTLLEELEAAKEIEKLKTKEHNETTEFLLFPD